MDKAVIAILITIFVSFGVNSLFLFSLPKAANEVALSGMLMTAVWVVSSGVSFLIAKHLSMKNYWALITVGTVSNCLALMFLIFGNPLVGSISAGIGIALTNTPTTYALLVLAPLHQRSLVAALDIVAARVGGALFVMVFGNALV